MSFRGIYGAALSFRGSVRADVERDPLGKRALGGRVSAKIKLIDTTHGPFPSNVDATSSMILVLA